MVHFTCLLKPPSCQANWRSEVAKNIQLLRRTGPFQLALLSHLRRDDKISPVLKAVWNHSLHSSCPGENADDLQKVHWRPVAESLLLEVTRSDRMVNVAVLSRLHDVPALMMPGSPVVMQILFPQLQGEKNTQGHEFRDVLLTHATRLAAVIRRCLPAAIWEALQAVGQAMSFGEAGLLGRDVITEVATRACSMAEWPGGTVFGIVRAHLQSLVDAMLQDIPRDIAKDGREDLQPDSVARALLPAVAAILLLPVSEHVARLQVQFPTREWPRDVPLHTSGTWQTIQQSAIQSAFLFHATELEDAVCSPHFEDRQSFFLSETGVDFWVSRRFYPGMVHGHMVQYIFGIQIQYAQRKEAEQFCGNRSLFELLYRKWLKVALFTFQVLGLECQTNFAGLPEASESALCVYRGFHYHRQPR